MLTLHINVWLTSHALADVTDKEIFDELESRISEDIFARNQYVLLETLGWTIRVEDRDGPVVQIKSGTPDNIQSYHGLPDPKCKKLCVSIKAKTRLSAMEVVSQLTEQFFKKAIGDRINPYLFRLKLAAYVPESVGDIGGSFSWPSFARNENPLGVGFDKHFYQMDPTAKELSSVGITKRDFSDPDRIHSSWVKRSNVSSSQAVNSLAILEHKSGCQIALGSLIHLILSKLYGEDIFDETFDTLIINNGRFRPSPLLPSVKHDKNGKKLLKYGPEYMVGTVGYIQGIFPEKIENQNYAGENFIITSVSRKAFNWLKKHGGWGYNQLSPEKEEDLFDEYDESELGGVSDPRLTDLSGLSFEMVRVWAFIRDLKKSSGLSYQKVIRIINGGDESKLDTNSKKTLESLRRTLQGPVFVGIQIWGHPGGDMSLGEWLLYLAEMNPKSPYMIMNYDYGFEDTQWETFKRAVLSYQTCAKHLRTR
ncbi:MAG: hypothetical protein KDD25_02970 [Bdellovibrionales bacterium]|nr:hypothetical protein [Bdellovibrionales bacterium]